MVNPLVVGLQAVRLVGDVLHIQAEAVEELAFKKLPAEKYDECEISNGVRAETEKRAFRGGSQWYERKPVIKIRSRSKFSLGIIVVQERLYVIKMTGSVLRGREGTF